MPDARRALDGAASPVVWCLLAAGLAAATLLLANDAHVSLPPDSDTYYRASANQPVLERDGLVLGRWLFRHGVPPGWSSGRKTRVIPAGGGSDVQTNLSLDYQLSGPAVGLQPGRYRLAVDARFLAGGVIVGVVNAGTDEWIRNSRFWSGQTAGRGQDFAVDFELAKSAFVRPVLSNWSPVPATSKWRIQTVELLDVRRGTLPPPQRLPTGFGDYYRARQSAPAAVVGDALRVWTFPDDLRQWYTTDGVQLREDDGAVELRTSDKPEYQLVGPPLALPAGEYVAAVDGDLLAGGMVVGVADATTGAWIGENTSFWSGQARPRGSELTRPFALDLGRRVQVVLVHWAPSEFVSAWRLRSVRIQGR